MKKFTFLLIFLSAILHAQIVDIHQFNSTTGAYPWGSLTLSGKILYGMTYEGGLYNQGCVFAVDTNGNNYRDLFDLHDTMGEEPRGSLLLSNGFLYGMTTQGGASNLGNVFRVDTGGNNYKNLLNFTGTNGRIPWGSLIQLGSQLFGMTQGGGTQGSGIIFSIDTDGTHYDPIYSFHDTGSTAGGPEGDLLFVNGKFYGMTEDGGAYSDGVLFSVDTNGHNFTDVVDFWGNIAPLGQYPKGSLIYANGILYGMAEQGGADDLGVVFSVDTNGNGYTVLQDFSNANGNDPVGNLILNGATLYGMTEAGGAHSGGLIFSIDTNGNNFTDVADFNGTVGSGPAGSLTLANGILYGNTYQGAAGYGAVFSTNICNMKVSITNQGYEPCYGSTMGAAVANTTQGSAPYTFNWSGGGGTGDTASNLAAGIYTVTVIDNNGCSAVASDTITQPATAMLITDSIQNVTCFGASTGSITLSVSGSNPPFTYTWGQIPTNDSTYSGLAAGNYAYTVTDANHCEVTAAYTINQPATAVTATPYSVSQAGQLCNGVAAITASGGTGTLTYFWETGSQTTDTIKLQCAGNYCCIITDSNGCADTTCVTINLGTGIGATGNETSIHIYPEPNNGYFMVEGITPGQAMELYDNNGQKLISRIADNSTMQFDISDMADGIYLMRILSVDGNLARQQKVVKVQ